MSYGHTIDASRGAVAQSVTVKPTLLTDFLTVVGSIPTRGDEIFT